MAGCATTEGMKTVAILVAASEIFRARDVLRSQTEFSPSLDTGRPRDPDVNVAVTLFIFPRLVE
jgi:hypothetical protein